MPANNIIVELLAKYPAESRVKSWPKSKSPGGSRFITEPDKTLGLWLTKMNHALNSEFGDWPDFMHGGIKRRSYVTYARQHVNKPMVITIDISKCFDSISRGKVASVLSKHLNLSTNVADKLAATLCYRGRLAQGFATSNFLCNLYILDPLNTLRTIFKTEGLLLGSYVDDIAISGSTKDPSAVINKVAKDLSKAGLKMKKSKTCVMPAGRRQVVCGLVVNKKLSLSKELKRELLSKVASHSISVESINGWIANTKSFDAAFSAKLAAFATRHGLIGDSPKPPVHETA